METSTTPAVPNTAVTQDERVVTVAFRKIDAADGAKSRRPLLQLEVLGHTHNLETVAELLFEYYLRDVRGEELYEHLWRFEPGDRQRCSYGVGYDTRLPLLSPDMCTRNVFSYPPCATPTSPGTPAMLGAGSELLFCYDEGSPTVLAVTFEEVSALPDGKSLTDYPAKKIDPLDEVRNAKKRRIESLPKLTISMDEAYPTLCEQVMRRGVRLDIGLGCDPCAGKGVGNYAMLWGGGNCPSFTSSIECPYPFENVDEMFLCFEKGIIKQSEPNHPAMIIRKTLKNLTTGVVSEEVKEMKEMEVHLRPYAASVDPATYKSEYIQTDMFAMDSLYRGNKDMKTLKEEERWAFNFALDAAELPQLLHNVNFSFARQFPKCTKWLVHPSKQSHWFSLEHGSLKAMKHKCVVGKQTEPIYETAKYSNVHDMFADMEEQLVLPKSWK